VPTITSPNRRRALAAGLALVAALATAACGSDDPAPPAGATRTTTPAPPTGSAGPSASASASALVEFTVDGAGPYQMGASLADLRPQLDNVTTGGETCPANTTANGKGTWSDIQLAFRPNGELYLLTNRSTSVPTPSGAWLGTSLADLKKIYAGVTGQELTQGSGRAYLVSTLGGRGILFDLDESQQVRAMIAGNSTFLLTSYRDGTDFC
jgi:hypothetical protein